MILPTATCVASIGFFSFDGVVGVAGFASPVWLRVVRFDGDSGGGISTGLSSVFFFFDDGELGEDEPVDLFDSPLLRPLFLRFFESAAAVGVSVIGSSSAAC